MSSPPAPDPALAPPAGADAPAWFDAVPSALLRVDAEGSVLAANAAARALLGADAAPGTHPLAHMGLDLASLPTEPVPCPGTERWLSLRALPLAGRQHLLQVDDVSELVRTRQALGRQHELLDLAQQFGRLGVWERDVRTLAGRWDRHVYKFWGLADDAGAPEFDAASRQVIEADRGPMEAFFRQSMRQAGTYGFRYRVRRHDGQLTQIHSQWAVKDGTDGQPDRVIGIMMDDTEAMDLARSRLELESQLSLAGTLAGLVVWRRDLKTDRVRFNDEGYALMDLPPLADGVPLDEVRARMHPDDIQRAQAATEATLAGSGSIDTELRYVLPGGGWRRMLSRSVAQHNDQGEAVAVLGVALDVTERDESTRRAREPKSGSCPPLIAR